MDLLNVEEFSMVSKLTGLGTKAGFENWDLELKSNELTPKSEEVKLRSKAGSKGI